MSKDEARAVIYATAHKMFKGEEWNVPRGIYRDAFSPYGKFDDPDFIVIDRSAFYIIRRIK